MIKSQLIGLRPFPLSFHVCGIPRCLIYVMMEYIFVIIRTKIYFQFAQQRERILSGLLSKGLGSCRCCCPTAWDMSVRPVALMTVASSLSTQGAGGFYLVGVPITVKNDHSVGRLEVQAEPPSPGAEQEDEVLRARLIEGFQQHAPILCFCGSCRV